MCYSRTRNIKDYDKTKYEVMRFNKKYSNAICVSGLASGIDLLGSNIFDKSIVYVTETIPKKKILETGLILSHVLPHNELTSDIVLPIEYGMKSVLLVLLIML